MSDIIIDPPVGPFSDEDDIRAWIDELQKMLKSEKDGTVQSRIHTEIARARAWLTPGSSPIGMDRADPTGGTGRLPGML